MTDITTVKHSLVADGAPFHTNGQLVNDNKSTAGTGSAKCACGWLSEELPTRAARKVAHQEHRMYPSTTPSVETAAPVNTDEEITMTDTAIEEPKTGKSKGTKAKAKAAPEPTPEQEPTEQEHVSESTVTVEFTNAAKHFWRSLSKGALNVVGSIEGVDDAHADYKTRSIVVDGTADATTEAAELLPRFWADAYAAIKAARKVEDSLAVGENEDKAARYARYKAEQGWLLNYSESYDPSAVAETADDDTDDVL